MPAEDIYKLTPDNLHALRGAACEELVVAVRRGAPAYTLREFVRVVDEVDARLDQRAAVPDTFTARARIAASKSPSARTPGRTPG